MAERLSPWRRALAALALAVVAAGLLAIRRTAAIGAGAGIALLVGGIALLYAPHWYVVGGHAIDGAPGVELNALLIGCLAGVAWARWPRSSSDAEARAERRGLDVIGAAGALALLPHGAAPFVAWDPADMRAWGEAMTQRGFPCGVALVWSLKVLELTSALARLARRLIVPACIGNLIVLVPGMWIAHDMQWFDVGPGEGGIEFSVALIACAIASILAYAPRRAPAPVLAAT